MSSDIRVERHAIQGAPDFELQIARDTPLEFELAFKPGLDHPGIVFYIAGFNDPKGYSEALLRSIVRDYGYAAVAVKYHCYRARIEQGASLALTTRSQALLGELISEYMNEQDRDLSNQGMTSLLSTLGTRVSSGVNLYAVLQPPGDEYQNFGVMQALDHIYVAEHLQREGLRANFGRIMLLGSSHGGYIAWLLAKLAPGFAAMIVDNSSYVVPPKNYIWDAELEEEGGCGRGECSIDFGRISLNAHCMTLWRHGGDSSDPFHYGAAQHAIRHMALREHFDVAKSYMAHSSEVYSWNAAEGDLISPANDKVLQHEMLDGGPIGMHLELVKPGDVDGRIFKSLEHGLGASLKSLFDRAHERTSEFPNRVDYPRIDRLSYDCGPKRYVFERTANPHFPMMLSLHDA